jgi:YD repeat-containing protein
MKPLSYRTPLVLAALLPLFAGVGEGSLSWGGVDRPFGTITPSVASSLDYEPASGRLETLSLAAGGAGLGELAYGWDEPRGLKVSREAIPAEGQHQGILANLGWAASYDAGRRMTTAETGRDSGALASWTYGYGKADELLLIQEGSRGRYDYTTGPLGRPLERSGPDGAVAFAYDTEGRRIADERFAYTWDWRGQLVAVDIKTGAHAGEKLTFSFDGLGRALERTHLGEVPEGGTEAERPFIAKRAFTWDGQRLACETGLNFQDQPIWRYHYLAGQRWLDDAPQVMVERERCLVRK